MSRIGKLPITIPESVQITISENEVAVKGPKGSLSQIVVSEIKIEQKDQELIVSPVKKTKNSQALWGLYRALIANMIIGVTEGFVKQLEVEGVGFKAEVKGKDLVLSLGLSHPVEVKAPPEIEFKVERNTITVSGIDKTVVGQVAANIRACKKPEPYKGKGIRYAGEVVRRKAGKKAGSTE